MSRNNDATLFTTVDDELFDQLNELAGQEIVFVEVWDDSLSDALRTDAADVHPGALDAGNLDADSAFDIDLYLADGVYLELYGAQCFPDLESEPWLERERVKSQLIELVKQGVMLTEIAVNEADGLVLILEHSGSPTLYIDVGGWLIEEWDELPVA